MPRDLTVSLKSGRKMTVPDVVDETLEDVLIYDGDTYRNIVTASDLGRPVAGYLLRLDSSFTSSSTNDAHFVEGDYGLNDPPEMMGIDDDKWVDDRVTATEPHHLQKRMSRYCWWDVTPLQYSSTLTTSSATVTLADTSNLAAGMRVQGPGVVDGTRIISVDSGTQITLSNPASATGAAILTFASAAPVAWAWADEVESRTSHDHVADARGDVVYT